ncbi:MAG: signal peptidase II [Bacillota bacterium]
MPFLYVTIFIVALDQISKLIIQARMAPLQSFPLIGGWFSLTYVANYGAAFGIMQSQTLLLIGITVGVVALVWFSRRQVWHYPRLLQVGLAVALGGAVGNLCDRVRLGYVVDFFDFHIWPVFNIADIAIITGVGLIILVMLRKDVKPQPRPTGNRVGGIDSTATGEDK